MKKIEKEKTEYEQGLADAWDAARKIGAYEKDGGLSIYTMEKIFGHAFSARIFHDFDASEVIAKIKEYENIKIGDEVIYQYNDHEKTGVVYDIVDYFDDSTYLVFNPFEFCPTDSVTPGIDRMIRKTGRHFSQIEEFLKAMKEE